MKTLQMVILTGAVCLLTMCSPFRQQLRTAAQLERMASVLKSYAAKNGYNTRYCLLIDMRLESGLKRFFIYDQEKKKITASGLVAHGSCTQSFLSDAKFSNVSGGECSSLGVYRVGKRYYGKYGKSYKLHGLQASNSNAFKRAIVLHAFSCVPDTERFPKAICNSSGCPMVSYAFLDKLSKLIDGSGKPVLLWLFDGATARKAQAVSYKL
jgi:L,D-transpeptidase catalytic domain